MNISPFKTEGNIKIINYYKGKSKNKVKSFMLRKGSGVDLNRV